MTFNVIADSEAKRDWDEAVGWYEARGPGVGLRLDDALRTLLQTLANRPERFRLVTRLTRTAKVPPPWNYSVYFTVNTVQREIKVLAVWHHSRNPAELRRRLK